MFRLFIYRSETPKQTEKKVFWFLRNIPKNNPNRLSFGLYGFEPKKKFDCFKDTLATVAENVLSATKKVSFSEKGVFFKSIKFFWNVHEMKSNF